jgi:hypothetical protein
MTRGDNERDVPAQQQNPTSEEEMIRGRGETDDMDNDDEFEDTEDLDDEQEEGPA